MTTFKDRSRGSWNGDTTVEHINAGSLQRIADATEVMAKNYLQLQADAERELRWRVEAEARERRLVRQRNALRGVIGRMRRLRDG